MGNWTRERFVGQMFKTFAKFITPSGMPAPVLWGDETVVRERLGHGVSDLKRRGAATISPIPSRWLKWWNSSASTRGRRIGRSRLWMKPMPDNSAKNKVHTIYCITVLALNCLRTVYDAVAVCVFRSRRGSDPREYRPPPASARPACSATSPPTLHSSEALLAPVASSLGWVGTTAHPGFTTNRHRLASCRISNSPGTSEGHSGGPSGDLATVVAEHNFLATTWWTASPLQSRGLTPSGSELGLFAVRIRTGSHAWILAVQIAHEMFRESTTTPCRAVLSKQRAPYTENWASFQF